MDLIYNYRLPSRVLWLILVPLLLVGAWYLGVQSSKSSFLVLSSQPSDKKFTSTNLSATVETELAKDQLPQVGLDDTREEAQMISSKKKLSNLERIEAGLGQVRAAIKAQSGNRTLDDPEYVPKGPCYWNPSAFHRSYLEMEKHFKIYVYEDGEPPVFHYSSSEGILGIEGILINQIELSKFRTNDPEKAHVYFLPFSVYSIVSYVYVVDSHEWGPMKNTASDYIDSISRKYTYWNRSLGSDHFMLACHDWAPEISTAVPYLYKNSIRVLCNANTSERFNPSKDVTLPEIYLPHGSLKGLIGGPSPSQRSVLVFYAGGIHGYIRQVLMEQWGKNDDPQVEIHEYLPKNVSYYGMIRKSKYCICPSGYEVASPRMVEALYMGCVPVLLKDHYVAPFSDVLNWGSFAVEMTSSDIPNLKKILMAIPQKKYNKMQRRGKTVRRHFEVNFPPKRYDVFHMILHSIWLRRLNIQVHDT
ncbi:probable glycosyltransferase At5g03795 isoform X2 [Lycium ferocissimum]|uniref:probable glycosyltransferase At5g03795 isoform X2 n=1 Tax=Lycium ferocissimum TaxID=112874 RepID=UPI002814E1CB|nr:probable glycosyltransferase At5g03795 isoform X2 [Lycium ferocissimum]